MHFSSRTNWNRQSNRLSQLLEDRRKRGDAVYDLTTSNPTECGITYPELDIQTSLANSLSLHYQPDPKGLLTAREAICRNYLERSVSVDPEQVLITASTSEAYAMIFKLLCNAGESILVPTPSYPLFEYLAQLHDIPMNCYRLTYDHGWHIDIDSLEEGISNTTKAIILIHPHNPTGMFLRESALSKIREIAIRHSCALIVDEVFSEYGFKEDEERVSSTAGSQNVLTFTLNGISKMLGLPQMKLGWIVVSGESAVVNEALERLEIISDTFLSVNTPVQAALPELFQHCLSVRRQILNRIKSNYSFLQNSILETPCSVLSTEGGWYGILRVPRTHTDEEWALRLLQEKGVYVHPGYFFDFEEEGYLVVSLLAQVRLFHSAIESMVQCISECADRRLRT